MHTLKILTGIIIVLVIIIATSFITSSILYTTSSRLGNIVDKIEASTNAENWKEAAEALEDFEKHWSGTSRIWAAIIDHIEIDFIEASIIKVSKYIDTRDKSLALAEAATLNRFIRHIPEKDKLALRNIF